MLVWAFAVSAVVSLIVVPQFISHFQLHQKITHGLGKVVLIFQNVSKVFQRFASPFLNPVPPDIDQVLRRFRWLSAGQLFTLILPRSLRDPGKARLG